MDALGAARRQAGRFAGAKGGVAAVEFAFVAPILLFMLLGTSEVGEALRVARRIDRIAFTIADLVSQSSAVTASELTAIFKSADAIIEPYGTTDLAVVVTVVDDSNEVVWSKAYNGGTPASAGDAGPLTVTEDTIPSGTELIIVHVTYTYEWLVATGWSGFGDHGYTFDQYFSMRPRASDTITYSNS